MCVLVSERHMCSSLARAAAMGVNLSFEFDGELPAEVGLLLEQGMAELKYAEIDELHDLAAADRERYDEEMHTWRNAKKRRVEGGRGEGADDDDDEEEETEAAAGVANAGPAAAAAEDSQGVRIKVAGVPPSSRKAKGKGANTKAKAKPATAAKKRARA